MFIMSDEMKDVAIVAGSSAATIITTLLVRLVGRVKRRKQLTLEEAVRKELWDEIASLRSTIREANATLVEWQSKYLTLLTSHQSLAERFTDEILSNQRNFTKLVGLLNDAMGTLDRIEEVERNVGENPNLERARAEIQEMKAEAQTIRLSVASLSKVQ